MQGNGTSIFWAGGDDDAIRLYGESASKQSLLAALLLADSVVLHPAYVYQEARTQALILDAPTSVIGPPHVQLILGDSATTGQYIEDRVRKLADLQSRVAYPISELDQYQRHGSDLRRIADALDERFQGTGAKARISWSRDRRFRDLIRDDLTQCTIRRPSLWDDVMAACMSPYLRKKVIDEIIGMTADRSQLVSVDSVVAVLKSHGGNARGTGAAESRLHLYHWESHSGDTLRVPIVSQSLHARIDPYDPHVFWGSTRRLLDARGVDSLLRLPWGEACRVAGAVRSDGSWRHYLRFYRNLVEDLDADLRGVDVRRVAAKLAERFPGRWRMMWDAPSWYGKSGFVVSLLTLLAPFGPIGWLGGVGLLVSAGDIVHALIGAAKQYEMSIQHDLAARLRSELREFIS